MCVLGRGVGLLFWDSQISMTQISCATYISYLLTYQLVKHYKNTVRFRDLVIGVDDAQLSRVLKGVCPEAEEVEEAAEGPRVTLVIHRLVAVQVYHLWRSVHRSGVTLDLCREKETLKYGMREKYLSQGFFQRGCGGISPPPLEMAAHP